jgi:hypothetical protein
LSNGEKKRGNGDIWRKIIINIYFFVVAACTWKGEKRRRREGCNVIVIPD